MCLIDRLESIDVTKVFRTIASQHGSADAGNVCLFQPFPCVRCGGRRLGSYRRSRKTPSASGSPRVFVVHIVWMSTTGIFATALGAICLVNTVAVTGSPSDPTWGWPTRSLGLDDADRKHRLVAFINPTYTRRAYCVAVATDSARLSRRFRSSACGGVDSLLLSAWAKSVRNRLTQRPLRRDERL